MICLRRQFTLNIKPYFLGKNMENIPNCHVLIFVFSVQSVLTFTTLWVNSVNDKFMIFSLFFPENRTCHFMQISSIGDNLHEMSNSIF